MIWQITRKIITQHPCTVINVGITSHTKTLDKTRTSCTVKITGIECHIGLLYIGAVFTEEHIGNLVDFTLSDSVDCKYICLMFIVWIC